MTIVCSLLVECDLNLGPGSTPGANAFPSSVWSIALSPDSNTVDRNLWWARRRRCCTPMGFEEDQTLAPTDPEWAYNYVNGVALCPDDPTITSISEDDCTARLWDLQKPVSATIVLSGPATQGNAVAFSPDGDTLAAGGADEGIFLCGTCRSRLPVRCRLRQN